MPILKIKILILQGTIVFHYINIILANKFHYLPFYQVLIQIHIFNIKAFRHICEILNKFEYHNNNINQLGDLIPKTLNAINRYTLHYHCIRRTNCVP